MPTIQQAIEQMATSPVFGGRYGLFIVSEGAFRELLDAGLPEDARLRERGYKSAVINDVPVIYSADYTGNSYLAIEKELIGILANNQQEKATDLAALRNALREMRPNGIDAMHLFALTDGEESWYGKEIDKTKYRIVLEDETEDSVYLKIIKKQQEKE